MIKTILLSSVIALASQTSDCDSTSTPTSSSGVHKATVRVPTGADGLTVEQRNIEERLKKDNEPGAIKHLYVMSAFSGEVLIYSTIKGKVTSSGKRLTPQTVSSIQNEGTFIPVTINGENYRTSEVLGDDGSYGSSDSYIYFWDTKGVYYQIGTAGAMWVVSDQPLPIKHVVLNFSLEKGQDQADPVPAALPAKTKK